MENPEGGSPASVQRSTPESKDPNEEGTEPPPKKPGSKEKGRKRTKTGCLSKPLWSFIISNMERMRN